MSQPITDTPAKPITVLVVEDDAVTRRALCLGIEKEPAFKLLDALDSVKSALNWLLHHPVDVLLVDLGLPDGSGIDIIRFCAQRYPACNIMVITTSSDQDSVVDSIEAGASGYVLKDAGQLDIGRSLLDLHTGGSPVSPTIARKLLSRMRADKKVNDALLEQVDSEAAGSQISLTKREATILDLIACGDSYGDVARQLALSVGTVQTHIKNIYEKLSVHSRGEAVYEANRRGLLQMDQLKSKR
ncbi:response regulator [Herminiimonas fonticola]|uniref:LuxR family two component transcriptional regulator n=1 Tax=Herminiimonas fonticola TaxID=303380 RepID=A0A4R6GGJ9_9BURK|nr:response regulator transcription factor [Herminiimonas fonticola]RBA24908.1 Response regulator containing a CheY-like receiver domain and an HTH DNA-binding domain [Herminiimonas fonticola]TDN94022.1 LuxR family two component transcriptional regulator [Herminiimonas fonticola]